MCFFFSPSFHRYSMATTGFLLLLCLLFIVFFLSHTWLLSPGLPHQTRLPLPQEQGNHLQSRLSALHFSRRYGVETARLATKQTPIPPSTRHKRTSRKAKRWGFGILEGMATGAVSSVVLFAILHFGKGWIMKHKQKGPVVFQRRISPKSLAFLEKEDAIETMELVGEGGAGQVYKTTLANGEVVAIKKVTPHIRDLMEEVDKSLATKYSKQVLAELETLGNIRHRNIVCLLAYVSRPDAHFLIYEYMPKRSLQEALFAGCDEEAIGAGGSSLTWPIRHKIAVGTCEGLTYLHFHCTQRIVHRDLKPGNILLDEDMEPHLGDFGLAKLLPDNATHGTSEHVAGTMGFIAPEVHQTLRYTDKCDVYSFGVVLIVILSGKKPSDQAFVDSSTSIAAWARQWFHSENRMEAFDPMLQAEKEEELVLALKVAVFCTATSPSERPTSKDVLQMLRQIRPLQSQP